MRMIKNHKALLLNTLSILTSSLDCGWEGGGEEQDGDQVQHFARDSKRNANVLGKLWNLYIWQLTNVLVLEYNCRFMFCQFFIISIYIFENWQFCQQSNSFNCSLHSILSSSSTNGRKNLFHLHTYIFGDRWLQANLFHSQCQG